MPNNPDAIQAILMPDDEVGICFTLEFCTPDGVWLYTLNRHKRRTFRQHLDERASQWKKGDPDIYEEMMDICIKSDDQCKRANA